MPTPPSPIAPDREMHRVNAAHASYPSLAARFWTHLTQLDPALAACRPDAVGLAKGERLQVQWWLDATGAFFAAQVMDAETAGLWEAFHVPAGAGAPVVGIRVCMGTAHCRETVEACWIEVFGDLLAESVLSGRHPAFVELLAAGVGPGGVSCVQDDQATIAQLEAEVQYWTHLTKTLDKAATRRSSSYSPPLPAPGKPGAAPVPAPALEWALSNIDEWATANSERIIIMNRAISATKRSPYESPALLFACLELLATEYTQVKKGEADRYAFKRKADELGLEYGGSVEPSVAGELGDLYFIRWGGRRRFLDQHLVKGGARDPRFCLRIYFTFCEDLQRVIVGHMPSHLPTGRS